MQSTNADDSILFNFFNKCVSTTTEPKDYVLIRTLLKCYGLWHYQSEIGRKIIFFIHHLCIVSMIIALGAGLTEKWSTKVNVIYENIICMTYFVGATIKYTILYIRRDQINQLYDRFWKDVRQKSTDKENKLLNMSVGRGRLINSIFLTYGVPGFIIVAVLTFYSTFHLSDIKSNYFPYYYYHEMIIDDRYYCQLVAFHVVATYVSTTFCYFMSCAVFLLLTTHVCGLFAIARHRLENVMEFADENDEGSKASNSKLSKLNRDDQVIPNLKNVIIKHNEAIKISRQIGLTFSIIIGIDQMGSLVCFGFTMYKIACHTGTNQQLMRNTFLLVTYLFYVYIFNWAGQEVLDACHNFFMSSYSIEWYNMSAKAKKLLLIIQQRASQTEKLTAGSIFILSINNLSWILQTSWSIAAVLLSSQNK